MKAVLISIQPEWCELIAYGKKKVEVRKTKPKLGPPFKCYIYCTKGDSQYSQGDRFYIYEPPHDTPVAANQTVIGEFVCDALIPISVYYSNPEHHLAERLFPDTGLTDKQIMDYLGNGKTGYGWHISNLEIYGKPKKLSEFYKPGTLSNADFENQLYDGSGDPRRRSYASYLFTQAIRQPPQSWCYVEVI